MKSYIYIRRMLTIFFATLMITSVFGVMPAMATTSSRTYTLDADFDEGILDNVEHDTVPDQLQLSEDLVSLPFIWVPNSNEGTVSKVDTETGKELGRYRTGPTSGGNPSRTTVDLMGNVWFGNRDTGTVVKIGLNENGQCKDTNGIPGIQTSQDSNNDGDITGAEVLAWGNDECVLLEVADFTGPRGIAVDSDNNVWAGNYGETGKYRHIDGELGIILTEVITNKPAYGAVMDANGILWSSEFSAASVGKLDPTGPAYTSHSVAHQLYGLGIDANEHLFISGWETSRVSKYDISGASPAWQWTTYDNRLYGGRGVVVTNDGDVWVACSMANSVVRLNNADGAIKASIPVGNHPTGVSVDHNGKVWVVNYNDGYIKRIDPATDTVDLSKLIVGSDGTGIANHYGYSDMTGFVSRTITTKTGTWTVDFDTEVEDMPWGKVSWNSDEPDGTSVTVRVRSSNSDSGPWSEWEEATNGISLSSTPDGRYLQIETTLQITSGEESPILYDLTVEVGNLPPVADAGPDQVVEQESLAGASVTLDGSGSTDDGLIQPLTYSWTWDTESASGVSPEVNLPPGTTTVTLEVDDGQSTDTDTVDITVHDTTPPEVACLESINPPGENIPPAGNTPPPGSQDGQNEDGFYELQVTDTVDPNPVIWLTDTENSFSYGLPIYLFTSGTTIKYAEVADVSAGPSIQEMGSDNADEVDWHILGLGELKVFAKDQSGNEGSVICYVPPPPK
jgi:streptogramin lyase